MASVADGWTKEEVCHPDPEQREGEGSAFLQHKSSNEAEKRITQLKQVFITEAVFSNPSHATEKLCSSVEAVR